MLSMIAQQPGSHAWHKPLQTVRSVLAFTVTKANLLLCLATQMSCLLSAQCSH